MLACLGVVPSGAGRAGQTEESAVIQAQIVLQRIRVAKLLVEPGRLVEPHELQNLSPFEVAYVQPVDQTETCLYSQTQFSKNTYESPRFPAF